MRLLHLPNELILQIARYLEFSCEIYALSRANHRLHITLNDYLYEHNTRSRKGDGLDRAVELNSESAVRRLLQHGAGPETNFRWIIAEVALQHASINIVKMLWQRSEDPNDPLPRCWIDASPNQRRSDKVHSNDERYLEHYKDWGLMQGAAEYGRADVLRMLIEKGLNPAIYWPAGEDRPLLTAAEGWSMLASKPDATFEVVKLLVELGCDIDVAGFFHTSPLDSAISARRADLVAYLVSQGADLESQDINDMTPLASASRAGDLEIVQVLVEAGACLDPPVTEGVSLVPLLLAAQQGHPELAEYLMQKIDLEDRVNGSTADRTTLLAVASISGDVGLAERLLSDGHDVNQPSTDHDRFMWTPRSALSWAAEKGHVAIVELLLRYGAQVRAPCDQGRLQPLAKAAESGHARVVEMLLDAGAPPNNPVDPSCTDPTAEDYRTILHIAAGQPRLCQLLLDHGAVPTPSLMLSAIEEGNTMLVQTLLDRGLKLRECDGEGWPFPTLFSRAIHGRAEALDILSQNHIKPNPESPIDLKPLRRAVKAANMPAIRYFLARRPRPNEPIPMDWQETLLDSLVYGHSGEQFGTMLDFLIAQGLNPHSLTKGLFRAVHERHLPAVRFLLAKGADPQWYNEKELRTTLEVADGGGTRPRGPCRDPDREILPCILEAIYTQIGNLGDFRRYILSAEWKMRARGNWRAAKVVTDFYWRRRYPVPEETYPV